MLTAFVLKVPNMLCSNRRSWGHLGKNYKTLRLCTSKRKARILLEFHDSLFLHIPTFHNTHKKLNLECKFCLCWVLAYNCENSVYINNKYFWQNVQLQYFYIYQCYIFYNKLYLAYYFRGNY